MTVVSAKAQTGPATREEKAGWIVLHLQGSPHDIGYQYGYLLAPEIHDADRALQLYLKHMTGRDWVFFRNAAKRLFWPKLDPEYREELTGLADGLKARGYPYTPADMLAHNGWIELDWYYLPTLQAAKLHRRAISKAPSFCSAFIATGRMTRDGKIVMAHNTWIDYIIGERMNVILDIRPQHGNRLMMDTWPGWIFSGSDFAINSAGLLITETTITGFTGFKEDGIPEFDRARKAAQYAGSLDDFVRIMSEGNNGGYANTWLVGDTKTNEIGKLELGLKNMHFTRSKDGAFFGCNLPENPRLIAQECVPGSDKDLAAVCRKERWTALLAANRGQIDAAKARSFLADTYDERRHKQGASMTTLMAHREEDSRPGIYAPYYPFGTVNAKVVTTDLAQHMQFWARMGFPDGSEFHVKPFLARHPAFAWQQPYLRSIQAHPWVLIGASAAANLPEIEPPARFAR